jgi:hypothetical protein
MLEICSCLLDFMPRFSHHLCVFLRSYFVRGCQSMRYVIFFAFLLLCVAFVFIVLSATVRSSVLKRVNVL